MQIGAQKKYRPAVTIDPNMPDLGKSPFALRQIEKAKAFIAKNGLPKETKPKKGK